MYFENMKFKINLMEFNSNYNFFFFQIFNMHKKNRGCYVRVYYISLTTWFRFVFIGYRLNNEYLIYYDTKSSL